MQTDNLTTEKTFAWLNENSRKFLAAGYLGEGITAEERIANIAKRAEEILQMPGYAEKFYHYMSQGYYSFCLLYTSPSPRDRTRSRMPSSA